MQQIYRLNNLEPRQYFGGDSSILRREWVLTELFSGPRGFRCYLDDGEDCAVLKGANSRSIMYLSRVKTVFHRPYFCKTHLLKQRKHLRYIQVEHTRCHCKDKSNFYITFTSLLSESRRIALTLKNPYDDSSKTIGVFNIVTCLQPV